MANKEVTPSQKNSYPHMKKDKKLTVDDKSDTSEQEKVSVEVRHRHKEGMIQISIKKVFVITKLTFAVLHAIAKLVVVYKELLPLIAQLF